MGQTSDAILAEIGLEAAQHVAGADTVERVEVVAGYDSAERPAYFFSFLIDDGGDRQRTGLIHIRLGQKLRDELIARGDEHYPIVRILSRDDWEKRTGA